MAKPARKPSRGAIRDIAKLAAILLVPVAGCGDKMSSNVRTFNLTQGMARLSNDEVTIYKPGDHLVFEVNGDCIVAGETKPCMRTAVAFEYEADGDRTILTCKSKFSAPTDVVNPGKIVAKDVTEASWTIELNGRKGKRVLRGYTTPDGIPKTVTTTTDCVLLGKSVLNYTSIVTEK
jgi:hypothetical protein